MMHEIECRNEETTLKLADISKVSDLLNKHVGMAVQSLQFEDMINQLSSHIEKRVKVVDTLFNHFTEVNKTITDSCSNSLPYSELNKQLKLCLENTRRENTQHKPVEQSAMNDGGDVELF